MKKLTVFALIILLASTAMADHRWLEKSEVSAFFRHPGVGAGGTMWYLMNSDHLFKDVELMTHIVGFNEFTIDFALCLEFDGADTITDGGIVWRLNGNAWTVSTAPVIPNPEDGWPEGDHYIPGISTFDMMTITNAQLGLNTFEFVPFYEGISGPGNTPFASYLGHDGTDQVYTESFETMPAAAYYSGTYFLKPIPEPTTLSLLGLGALACLFRRKNRG